MNTLLRERGHENVILSTKELQQLHDICSILEPFAEATDMTKREKMVTLSCVVAIVLSLNNHLVSRAIGFCADAIRASSSTKPPVLIRTHSGKFWSGSSVQCPSATNSKLSFGSNIFL